MKEKEPIIVCRPLFYTVVKYIYIFMLGFMFIGCASYTLLRSNLSFMAGVFSFVGYLIVLFIVYLFFNWFYKCVLKTMLALTDKELHLEYYMPFIKYESTLPLDSIKRVTTLEYFWIFRAIIIHQYHKLPIIFPTWNNKEMKDEINALIIKEKEHVKNDAKNGELITKENYKIIFIILGCILGIFLFISMISHIANYSKVKSYVGTYEGSSSNLKLNADGTCEYGSYDCTWEKTDESYVVDVTYEYETGHYYTYTTDNTITVRLDVDTNTYEFVY